MFKKIAFILAVICMLSLIGCDDSNGKEKNKPNTPENGAHSDVADEIEIGEENGVAYFERSEGVPEIIVIGNNEKKINDAEFFANLVSAIDGKEIVGICDCAPKCSIRIDNYTFRLKDDAIELFEEANGENKFLGMVECTREEMNALFSVIDPDLVSELKQDSAPDPSSVEYSHILVQSNYDLTVPYLNWVWSSSWDSDGGISADGFRIEYELPEICDELPVITYGSDFQIHCKDEVSYSYLRVYDEDFERVEDINLPEDLAKLPQNVYYLIINVSVQGKYVEAVGKYNSSGYECAYKMIVPRK